MSKKFIFFFSLLIILLLVLFCIALASAAGVSEDGAGDWRISTYTVEASQYPHMVIGIVFVPGKGITYEKYYGFTDTTDCSLSIVTKKENRKAQAYYILYEMLSVLGHEKYTISMAVSICHPEWYVIYISRDKINVSKKVYDKVFKALQ